MELSAVSLIVNVLMGVVMYFMKSANDSTGERIKNAETQINQIKDSYIRKEDFRDFKEELFIRLDEMKYHFRQEIERLNR